MKKQIVSAIIAMALASTLLVGCGSNTSESVSATELTIETEVVATEKTKEATTAETVNWPKKQITIVCPFSAGGSGDTIARLIAPELQAKLGVPVVVTNRTGAGGAVGLEFVRNSDPDGYTLVYFSVDTCILSPMGVSDVTCEDFRALGRAIVNPSALTVRSDSKYNTMQDFIDDIKTNPGVVTEGNSGTGAFWHICASAFENATGGEMTHVPFDGAAGAAAALLGGNIDAVFVAPGEIKSSIESGDFKVLANLGEERSLSAPDVPTAQEMGLDIVIQGWGGLAAPKDTPDEIMGILKTAFSEAVQSESVKQAIIDRGLDYSYASGEDLDAAAKEQLQDYTELIEELGIASK